MQLKLNTDIPLEICVGFYDWCHKGEIINATIISNDYLIDIQSVNLQLEDGSVCTGILKEDFEIL